MHHLTWITTSHFAQGSSFSILMKVSILCPQEEMGGITGFWISRFFFGMD